MTLKEKVQSCQRICGDHVNLGDSAVSEIWGALGYDFLWVDMEHTRLTEDDATLQRYHDMGIRMLSTGADYVYMLAGAQETLRRVRGIQK